MRRKNHFGLCVGLMAALMLGGHQGALAAEQMFMDLGYEDVVMPTLKSTSVIVDDDTKQPVEPNIGEVDFLKMPATKSIGERVERLMYSITTDVKPEYDHYGHELRRYMSRIGNIKGFSDREYLEQQIRNVRSAQIVAKYWKMHLEDQIAELGEIVENDPDVSFAVRMNYRQNVGAVQAFLIDLNAWLDANERLLVFVYQTMQVYTVEYPEIIIATPNDRIELYNLISARQSKLLAMREYTPFSMMVY